MIEDIRPKHIAIIPDGNRRFAKKTGISIREAYAKGIRHIGDVLKWCKESDVRMLSMWGFSTENFERDKNEVTTLFELFRENLDKIIRSDERNKNDLKIHFFGRLNLLPFVVQKMMQKSVELTQKNSHYQLNLFLAYGGRQEIVDAVNNIIKKGIKKVDEKTISHHLYTNSMPDPDLIIRTSGEERLSGLMPWQSCYSELYFSKKLWPEFSKKDFLSALKEYSKRKRRFGK